MTEKPCPRCEGFAVTWINACRVQFCDIHLGEIIKSISVQAIDAGTDKTEGLGPKGESAVAKPCTITPNPVT